MVYTLTAMVALLLAQDPQGQRVGTGPEPSPNPIAWEFEFKFLDAQRIEVQLPGSSAPEVYWYMVYTVTNNTSRTQRFFPTFQLVTEDLTIIETDKGITPLVFNAIRERHRITHKYLVHPTKAIGDLHVGDDNARESVAIWRQIDPLVNQFTIYVAGLSGETRFVRNPAYDPGKPETATVTGPDGRQREQRVNPKHFTLRKTLEIRYNLPGSAQSRRLAEPQRVSARWIMR